MRITKKLLRDMKRNLMWRAKQLGSMMDEDIEREWARCFPNRGPESTPAFVQGKRADLFTDLINCALSDHWCE